MGIFTPLEKEPKGPTEGTGSGGIPGISDNSGGGGNFLGFFGSKGGQNAINAGAAALPFFLPGASQANSGTGFGQFNQGAKGLARSQGLETLLQILMSQGATSPLAFNRQSADIDRGTQAQQQGTQASLARQGLAGSGLGQFIGAAQGQAGEDRQAGLLADETARAEDRMRNDLGLLLQLLINPSLQRKGINAGVAINNAGLSTQRSGQKIGAGLGGLQALFDALSNSERKD